MPPDHPFLRKIYVSFAFSYVFVLKQSAFFGLTAGYLLFYSRKPATTCLFGWATAACHGLQEPEKDPDRDSSRRKKGPGVLGDVGGSRGLPPASSESPELPGGIPSSQ